jgi:hypothetical protein
MNWNMETVYQISAGIGGAVLLLQMLLLLFAGGADDFEGAEVDLDHDDGSVGLLSTRAIASFLAFFGLTGWYGVVEDWSASITVFTAFAAGASMMFIVAWLMAQLRKLYSEGNLKSENAIGKSAIVYLKVPGEHSGLGKITVTVQGRTAEYQAQTAGPEIPTGHVVHVVGRASNDVFEVQVQE